MTPIPRVVVVTRATPYEELLARHATRSQAEFFLKQRGQSLAGVEAVHHRVRGTLARVLSAVPLDWRRNTVDRSELDRFLFEPDDTIVVVGQDGLVANLSKYLDGQPVLGVNPTPDLFDGVLVRFDADEGSRLIEAAARREVPAEARTMVEVTLDDGQTLSALNEVFLGQRTHQSARYEITCHEKTASHSSSGVIVTTGTGSTGWARSIHLERGSALALPGPTEARLAFFVREAFPSVATSTELREGSLQKKEALVLTSRMEEGVVFGDGIEADHLRFEWGVRATVRIADKKLMLVAD